MRMDDSCFVEADGGRKILRTRAGLGSGLEAILPAGLWTNIPVSEKFAQASPYVLHKDDGRYMIRRYAERATAGSAGAMTPSWDEIAEIHLAPRPDWYKRRPRPASR